MNQETLQNNVARLESYKSKLILFPRRDAKPKKGEVNDSTAEVLSSAAAKTQNKDHFLVAKPTMKPRQKVASITEEMKKARVFMRCRQARADKRYKGTRERRAKEEAEKLKI